MLLGISPDFFFREWHFWRRRRKLKVDKDKVGRVVWGFFGGGLTVEEKNTRSVARDFFGDGCISSDLRQSQFLKVWTDAFRGVEAPEGLEDLLRIGCPAGDRM